eukprot:TRINITY_DN17797_c0_g2_i1.p1 TRINITY_DN17797_c0_g2~~TRINITY_DN17797_c0_g2_i1.p1  ORF type:complete len:431 (+),score=66.20 TRINITY_DN17797_c0_g2_i1:56-1348(+)
MKSMIMPYAARVLSGSSFNRARDWAYDTMRYCRMQQHTIYFYHAPEDAVSNMMLQVVAELEKRYPNVKIVGKTVLPCEQEELVPRKDNLKSYATRDMKMLSDNLNLKTLPVFEGTVLVSVRKNLIEIEQNAPSKYISSAMDPESLTQTSSLSDASVTDQLQKNTSEMMKCGYWLPGTVYYQGSVYSIDRVKMLEDKLQGFNLQAEGVSGCCLKSVNATVVPKADCLEVWLSPRSPYSYIALFRLAREWDIRSDGIYWCDTKLVLKPTMPSAMRGIPIPEAKKMFIFTDAARVCRHLSIPFGFVSDPLGAASKNVLKICHHIQSNKDQYKPGSDFLFLLAATTGCWSQGVDLNSVSNLIKLGAPLGISNISEILASDSDWESVIASNKAELEKHSLWGVPSFRYGNQTCWGQDRMWIVKQWCGTATDGPVM